MHTSHTPEERKREMGREGREEEGGRKKEGEREGRKCTF